MRVCACACVCVFLCARELGRADHSPAQPTRIARKPAPPAAWVAVVTSAPLLCSHPSTRPPAPECTCGPWAVRCALAAVWRTWWCGAAAWRACAWQVGPQCSRGPACWGGCAALGCGTPPITRPRPPTHPFSHTHPQASKERHCRTLAQRPPPAPFIPIITRRWLHRRRLPCRDGGGPLRPRRVRHPAAPRRRPHPQAVCHGLPVGGHWGWGRA